jgi:hypothetical protein
LFIHVLFTNYYCIIIYIFVYIIYLVSQTLTDSGIIDAVLGRKLNESEDSDDSNGSVDENKMTVAEAISCCDNHINFMERKSFATEQKIMQIYRLKEKFEKERRSKSKQTTLTDLFKRAVASSNPSLSADSVTRNPDKKLLCPTLYLQIKKDFTVNKFFFFF